MTTRENITEAAMDEFDARQKRIDELKQGHALARREVLKMTLDRIASRPRFEAAIRAWERAVDAGAIR